MFTRGLCVALLFAIVIGGLAWAGSSLVWDEPISVQQATAVAEPAEAASGPKCCNMMMPCCPKGPCCPKE